MLKKSGTGFLTIGLLALLLASCSDYQKLLSSADTDLKYKRAIEYFDKKDYTRASALMEMILPIYRGTDKAEEVNYRYAYCYYHQQEYEMASYYFKNFVTSFPNSPYAEECAYMYAYCFYEQSPISSLDQANTYKALDELQMFMNQHPASKRITDCNKLIDELREKLVKKSFDSASLYYKLSDFKAAITALNNGLKEFPDTHYREELLFLVLKSSYELAIRSVYEKMKERFQNTTEAYLGFKEEFPQSKHLKEAERIYTNTTKYLK
ncbi:MAG: outer membrane protein assembly factor BamD [Bacteroidia bacterium]|nr:outer membrane protein assembly factor BamD [Bacteroidia bacterium]